MLGVGNPNPEANKSDRREVVRGLVFDAQERLLLVHWRDPLTDWEFWEPPGGARKAGESLDSTLRREIKEETGFIDVDVQRFLATIDHRFTFAGRDFDCIEHYFVCRLTGPDLTTPRLEDIEQKGIVGIDWFSDSDIKRTQRERLEPPELASFLDVLSAGD